MSTNLEAAQSGDRRLALEVLRDSLAGELDACENGTLAQIAAQYRATLDAISALGAAEGKSKRDELAERRKARAAGRGAAPEPVAAAKRRR